MQVLILWTVLLLAAVTAAVYHLGDLDNVEYRDNLEERDKRIEHYDENNFTVAIEPNV